MGERTFGACVFRIHCRSVSLDDPKSGSTTRRGAEIISLFSPHQKQGPAIQTCCGKQQHTQTRTHSRPTRTAHQRVCFLTSPLAKRCPTWSSQAGTAQRPCAGQPHNTGSRSRILKTSNLPHPLDKLIQKDKMPSAWVLHCETRVWEAIQFICRSAAASPSRLHPPPFRLSCLAAFAERNLQTQCRHRLTWETHKDTQKGSG